MDSPGLKSREGQEIFSYPKAIQTGNGARQAPCSMGTGVFPGDKAAGAWKLTAHLHLVPILRMRGAVPPLPLYTFMASDRDTFT